MAFLPIYINIVVYTHVEWIGLILVFKLFSYLNKGINPDFGMLEEPFDTKIAKSIRE